MRRIVLVSATYVDTVLTVPYYPAEDEKLRATSLTKRRGGNGANTAEVLQQLVKASSIDDLRINLVSVFPAKGSPASKMIENSLLGVDCSQCVYRDGYEEPASSYILRSQDTGSRTSVSHNDLPEMTVAEFTAIADELGDEACWYHFEGRVPDVLKDYISYLQSKWPTTKISVEFENPKRPGLERLAVLPDVLFFSKSWAVWHGCASAQQYLALQLPNVKMSALVFCSWAEGGADALRCKDKTHAHVDAVKVEQAAVVDSIGAGDTFIAGALFMLLRNAHSDDLSGILRYANELAGRKIQQEAFAGLASSLTQVQ